MNKYTSKRISGLVKLKGKTYEEVFGVEKTKAMKDKMRIAKLGKKRPDRTKSHIEKQSGSNHWNWKGGISRTYKTGYYSPEYKKWRKSVFERDNYTCQACGFNGASGYITAHHIKSFAHFKDLRYELANGLTLCEPCHANTDNYKGRNKKLDK